MTTTCLECGHPRRQLRVIELGAATGALAIFLAALGVDIHTSDIDDTLVTENIACNFTLNGFKQPAVHLPHTWGEELHKVDSYVQEHGAPDVILGSDILAYEESFGTLADTIEHLMPISSTTAESAAAASASSDAPAASTAASTASTAASAAASPSSSSRCSLCHPPAVLLMCWKRSHNKSLLDDGFWRVMHERGFGITTRGNKTYEIRRGRREIGKGQSYVGFVKDAVAV